MEYTRIIKMIGGEDITITENEYKALKEELSNRPKGFVEVQGQLLNKSSIAKIGSHHATNYMNRIEKAQENTNLMIAESEVKLLNK